MREFAARLLRRWAARLDPVPNPVPAYRVALESLREDQRGIALRRAEERIDREDAASGISAATERVHRNPTRFARRLKALR